VRINIADNWYIDTDVTNFTLIRTEVITGNNSRGKRPLLQNIGKDREITVGYYGTLRQALDGYMNHCVKADLTINADVLMLLSKLDEIRAAIERVAAWTPARASEMPEAPPPPPVVNVVVPEQPAPAPKKRFRLVSE
jgi:hypothetical protein